MKHSENLKGMAETPTGLMLEFPNDRELTKALEENRHLAPITEVQQRAMVEMPTDRRKGYMRNQPCVCGSGKKFKRCCWSIYK